MRNHRRLLTVLGIVNRAFGREYRRRRPSWDWDGVDGQGAWVFRALEEHQVLTRSEIPAVRKSFEDIVDVFDAWSNWTDQWALLKSIIIYVHRCR